MDTETLEALRGMVSDAKAIALADPGTHGETPMVALRLDILDELTGELLDYRLGDR